MDASAAPGGTHDEEDPYEAVPHLLPAEVRRRARRLAVLYTAAGVVLLPWIAYLAVTLPKHNIDRHYRGAWVGFDIILVAAVMSTAYFAFRLDPRVQFPATATAVLLFVDAWFDVTTSGSRHEVVEALVLAVFIELPAAVFSLVVAHRVNRRSLELVAMRHTSEDGAVEPVGRVEPMERVEPVE